MALGLAAVAPPPSLATKATLALEAPLAPSPAAGLRPGRPAWAEAPLAPGPARSSCVGHPGCRPSRALAPLARPALTAASAPGGRPPLAPLALIALPALVLSWLTRRPGAPLAPLPLIALPALILPRLTRRPEAPLAPLARSAGSEAPLASRPPLTLGPPLAGGLALSRRPGLASAARRLLLAGCVCRLRLACATGLALSAAGPSITSSRH